MRKYEELSGAHGRQIFYRAERYATRDLFRRIVPAVEVGDVALALHDLSMSGLAVVSGRTEAWSPEPGAELAVCLRLDDTVVHQGRGRVCRVETTALGTKVGLNLTSGYLDIPAIIAKHEELAIRRELETGLGPDHERVDPEYRRVSADVAHLLRRYKSVLTKLRANGYAAAAEARADEILSLCEERIIPEWRSLWHRANEIVMSLGGSPEALQSTKRFTELVVTPEFMEGPIWRRSYEKPLGYPGDYQIMNYVYSWSREGDTPYGRLVHRLGLEVAECIATRMVMVQQAIGSLVAADPGGGPVHIASVGCGPAQEVLNYLQLKSLPRPAVFTLIDQDHGALSHAYHRIYPEVARLAGEATVKCLQVSFTQLLKSGELFGMLRPQDLIYSVGLIDYLAARRARSLIANLFDQLAPGGLLIVGNMRATATGNIWPMEFICDWSLIYRSEREMWELVDGLAPASAEIETDPTGRVYMMYLRKG